MRPFGSPAPMHPASSVNFSPPQRRTVRRAELGVRVGQLDVGADQKALQKGDVRAWVAGHLAEFWQRLAIGLANIENVTRLEPENRARGRDVVSPNAIAGVMKRATQLHRYQDRDALAVLQKIQ